MRRENRLPWVLSAVVRWAGAGEGSQVRRIAGFGRGRCWVPLQSGLFLPRVRGCLQKSGGICRVEGALAGLPGLSATDTCIVKKKKKNPRTGGIYCFAPLVATVAGERRVKSVLRAS